MLSDKAIKILADNIAPEVIERLQSDEQFIECLHEVIPTLITDIVGECDEVMLFEMALIVFDQMRISARK
jgi:hypothetical protein